jgi:hypothetical protein
MGVVAVSDESLPTTPSPGVSKIFADDTVLPVLRMIDDAGNNKQLSPIYNASAAGQSPVAATRTYLTGSNIAVPTVKLKVGGIYRCRFDLTKTAAGTATSTIDVCVGTNGTTADTARLSFTKPAGTAAADEGWCEIDVTVKANGATGVLVGTMIFGHNLSATGHMTIPTAVQAVTSASFDMTTANLILGVCLTTGAADVITVVHTQAELLNN